MEDAVQLHQAGRLDEAETIYRRLLRAEPAHPDAMHLLGVIELQRGAPRLAVDLISESLVHNPGNCRALNHLGEAYRAQNRLEDASRSYQEAIRIDPAYAEAHNNLGIAFQAQGRLDDATACFRRAIAVRPNWGGAHFNLGLSLKRKGDLSGAASAFTAGWLRDPVCLEAAGQCVATIAEQARGAVVEPPLQLFDAPSRRLISVVFCSVDDVKTDRTISLYRRLLSSVPHEIIPIRDARSLAEAYNRAIPKSRGDIVVLSHDDIDILAPDFAARLQRYLQRFDIVGVAGGTALAGPQWTSCGHPYLRGWITHREAEGGPFLAGVLHPRATEDRMITLDGVFLAARREVFDRLPFDQETFDGFHLYDVDWSYRAARAGFVLGAAGDLLVVHASRGNFGEGWRAYADRFCQKHRITPRVGGPAMLFEAALDNDTQVRQFFSLLDRFAIDTGAGGTVQ